MQEDLYRASTYDLSIEGVVPSGGIMPEGSKFPLQPRGMVPRDFKGAPEGFPKQSLDTFF